MNKQPIERNAQADFLQSMQDEDPTEMVELEAFSADEVGIASARPALED